MSKAGKESKEAASHPTRGAWIEIGVVAGLTATTVVAPHTGCVD